MVRRSHMRTVIFLIGGLAVLALAAQGVLAKPLRPAATSPSPEGAQLKQLLAPAQQVGRPSKSELLARCQQRPACRAKLDAAQKGQKPATVRPAATSPSSEALELKKLPTPATPVTPRRFQGSGLGLRPLNGLLAWLNPFRPPVAEAQQVKQLTPMIAASTRVSIYLTPQNPYIRVPDSHLRLYGIHMFPGNFHSTPNVTVPSTTTENKPFVYIEFSAPASGWYIIDVRASSAAAKLLHGSGTSQSIIETWAAGSLPCSASICDYATMEYLQQGFHYFYFYSPTHVYTFYSVSIESYP